jgi:ferrous iron transport protein A
MKNATIRALNTFEIGRRGVIVTVKGDKELQKRLISMGLYVGSDVEVLHQGENGALMLIAVGETRLALGQDMTKQILVAPLPDKYPSWSSTKTHLKRCFRNAWHGGHDENVFRRFRRGKQGKNCRIRKRKFGIS